MNSIERRIERAEETLGMSQEPIVYHLVHFGDSPLPPEERRGNVIVRHVTYESIRAAKGQESGDTRHKP